MGIGRPGTPEFHGSSRRSREKRAREEAREEAIEQAGPEVRRNTARTIYYQAQDEAREILRETGGSRDSEEFDPRKVRKALRDEDREVKSGRGSYRMLRTLREAGVELESIEDILAKVDRNKDGFISDKEATKALEKEGKYIKKHGGLWEVTNALNMAGVNPADGKAERIEDLVKMHGNISNKIDQMKTNGTWYNR